MEPLFADFLCTTEEVMKAKDVMRQSKYGITAIAVWMLSIGCSDVPVLQPDAGAVADARSQSPDSALPPVDATPSDAPSSCVTTCVSPDELLDCEGGGEVVTCPLGCDGTATPRCRQLVPSNGLDAELLLDVSEGLVVPSDATATVDTDSGVITGIANSRAPGTGVRSGIRFQLLSNGLSVFAVKNMDIQGQIEATGSRPLIILSAGQASVSGTIDVSANGWVGGVGGGDGAYDSQPATGCAPGAIGVDLDSDNDYSGGGGGGLGANGAPGGMGDNNDPGGAGGDISACPGVLLEPLQGGSGGGMGDSNYGGGGGGGGGAVQITSYTEIAINGGTMAASGAGGGSDGGGGGSGGAILLEAPVLSLNNAILAANGGGGGTSYSSDGQDGRLDEQPASGGDSSNTCGSDGGNGGSLLASAQPGEDAGGCGGGGGGGGGGVGIIHLKVPAAGLTHIESLTSPAESRSDPATE